MDFVLEHGEHPKSVFAFAKMYNFEEAKFYDYFGSFESIEKNIFTTFFTNTLKVLEKSEDYQNFDARNKLLSFYYTFFENLTANRSYVKWVLDRYKTNFKGLKVFSDLKRHFSDYISQLGIETLDLKQEKLEKIQDRALKESAWIQLVLTMKFWLDDTSPSFEKTDIFIEKSVNTTFDVLNIAPIQSVLDLGKFLFKEKLQMG